MIEVRKNDNLSYNQTNVSQKVVKVSDVAFYNDALKEKYCFITFSNLFKQTFYSLSLTLNEFDKDDNLLSKDHITFKKLYCPKGMNVESSDPIKLAKECHHIEIHIDEVMFSTLVYRDDHFVDANEAYTKYETKLKNNEMNNLPLVKRYNELSYFRVLIVLLTIALLGVVIYLAGKRLIKVNKAVRSVEAIETNLLVLFKYIKVK